MPITGPSDTALGDWYVNRLVVDRQPLLLLVSAASLLPILVRARDVRALPSHLVELVRGRLARLGVWPEFIEAECRAMSQIQIGRTIDRSILGILVDFAKVVRTTSQSETWNEARLLQAEDLLAETPCHASRRFEQVVFPDRKTKELLRAKWAR